MFYSLKKFPIDLFIEKDADMVTSVANDLLESTEESNTAEIAGALEDIIKFSFGKKKNSKAIGQELIDLTFDLIKRHRYDFEKNEALSAETRSN